jgi:hypothetical protein
MAQLSNTFETGIADGTTITAANSDDGTAGNAFDFVNASGTRVFDTDLFKSGARSLLLGSSSGTTPYVAWSAAWTASTDIYVRMYFRVSALPTGSSATLIQIGNSTDAWGIYYPRRESGTEPVRADEGGLTTSALSFRALENNASPGALTGDNLEKWRSPFHILIVA